MNAIKIFALALGNVMLVGCLTGCSAAAASQGGAAPIETISPQASNKSVPSLAVSAEDGGEYTETIGGGYDAVNYEEQFKPYAQFGLTYDASKNELWYNGKVVRWFEDYYSTSADGGQAGTDFFNENGVVDVYAVRDLSSLVYNNDGSFDPSGKLIGVNEFSEEEFAARDIEAIKNPQPITLISGDRMLTTKELEDMAKEYEAFGVTYDVQSDQWYFNGEKVRYFQDVLTTNGEGLTSGNFNGAIRNSWNANGTIDIYTVRDFTNPNADGTGTLVGVEKFSQTEFDEHTQRVAQSSSGFCIVTQG